MKKELLVLSLLFSQVSFADMCKENKSRYDRNISPTQCATAGVGAGVAVGSGIFAAKKYGAAKDLINENRQTLFSRTGEARVMDIRDGNRVLSSVTDGDRVRIHYQLSDEANRTHHIQTMESNASSARSSASYHQMRALTATKTETTRIGDTTTTRTVPDHAARARSAILAIQYTNDAAEYDRRAMDARNGGKVPVYDFEKVFDEDTGTRNATTDYVREKYNSGSKITKVTRLPVEQFQKYKSIMMKGHAGVAGVVIGTSFAIEEMISGMVAEEIENSETINLEMSDY